MASITSFSPLLWHYIFMNMSKYELRKRFAGIFWWSFCLFWALYIPFEPLIGVEVVCFITGAFYISIEKRVDKFMELGTYEYDVKWTYFFFRGLLAPIAFLIIFTLSGEKEVFIQLNYYFIGFMVSHLFYSLWKASKI